MCSDFSSEDNAKGEYLGNERSAGSSFNREPSGKPSKPVVRIRNQYLLAILASVIGLGTQKISEQALVDQWKLRDHSVDDIFFMHYDILFDYGFLERHENGDNDSSSPESFRAMIKSFQRHSVLISVTHEGQEFLDRYGVR